MMWPTDDVLVPSDEAVMQSDDAVNPDDPPAGHYPEDGQVSDVKPNHPWAK